MIHRIRFGCLLLALLLLSGCGNAGSSQENAQADDSSEQETVQTAGETAERNQKKEVSSGKILIAYFTLADNYENPSDMDATSQASINVEGKELIGNTEYLANAIRSETGGRFIFCCSRRFVP